MTDGKNYTEEEADAFLKRLKNDPSLAMWLLFGVWK